MHVRVYCTSGQLASVCFCLSHSTSGVCKKKTGSRWLPPHASSRLRAIWWVSSCVPLCFSRFHGSLKFPGTSKSLQPPREQTFTILCSRTIPFDRMGPSLESHACLQLVILLSAACTGECRTCGSPHNGDLSRVAPARPATTSVQDEASLGPLAGVGQDAPIPARTALSGAEDTAQFNLAPHTFDEIMHAPEIMSAPEGSLSHRAARAFFSETRIRSSNPTTHTHSGLRDGAGSRDFPIARHTQQHERAWQCRQQTNILNHI